MERHIVSYLFQHKKCPLPGIGVLELHDGSAYISHADKKVMAPRASIRLTNSTLMPDALQEYIAGMENQPVWSAQNQLTDFCRRLQNLDANAEMPLTDAGVFYRDAEGKLNFHSVALPLAFAPDADATKVIHPEATHEILVGDKQTTNAEMTEYFSTETPAQAKRWWVFPMLLAAVAIGAIVYYFNSHAGNASSGNMQRVEANEIAPAYQLK